MHVIERGVVQEARGTALRALTQPEPKAVTRHCPTACRMRRRFPDGMTDGIVTMQKTRMALTLGASCLSLWLKPLKDKGERRLRSRF